MLLRGCLYGAQHGGGGEPEGLGVEGAGGGGLTAVGGIVDGGAGSGGMDGYGELGKVVEAVGLAEARLGCEGEQRELHEEEKEQSWHSCVSVFSAKIGNNGGKDVWRRGIIQKKTPARRNVLTGGYGLCKQFLIQPLLTQQLSQLVFQLLLPRQLSRQLVPRSLKNGVNGV